MKVNSWIPWILVLQLSGAPSLWAQSRTAFDTSVAVIEIDDPIVDRDPFFMRGQRWIDKAIDGAGGSPALEVDQDLKPILQTDDYFFFAARDPKLLRDKTRSRDDTELYGVFFISRARREYAASTRTPVPIFFLPLPTGNWDGQTIADEMPEQDAVLFRDGESTVPVSFAQIDTIAKAESLHLQLALLVAQVREPTTHRGLPARDSTAGFGTIFLESRLGVGKIKSSAPILQRVYELLLPTAGASADWLPSELQSHLIHVATVIGAVSIGSITLMLTECRDALARQRREAAAQGKRKPWLVSRFQEFLTVEAHLLLTLYELPRGILSDVVEFNVDRWAPRWGSGKTSPVRKAVERTFVQGAKNIYKAPVNYLSMLLGVGVYGLIDTIGYALNQYVAAPFVLGNLGGESASQVASQMASVGVYALSWLAVGALYYSSIQKAQRTLLYAKQVDQEMRAQGLDPNLLAHQEERTRRIDVQVETYLVSTGLAGKRDFLFDYSSIREWALGKLGMSTERPGLRLSARRLAKKGALTEAQAYEQLWNGNPEEIDPRSILNEKNDFLGLWQKRKILADADRDFLAHFGYAYFAELAGDTEISYWKSRYIAHYQRKAGLRQVLPAPDAATEEAVRTILESPEQKAFLPTLSSRSQTEFVAALTAIQQTQTHVKRIDQDSGRIARGRAERAYHALFAREDYRLGLVPLLYRNVPLLSDIATNMKLKSMFAVSAASLEYLSYKYLWGIDVSYSIYLYSMLFVFLSESPNLTVNRLLQSQGIAPMKNAATVALMATLYSAMTLPFVVAQQSLSGFLSSCARMLGF